MVGTGTTDEELCLPNRVPRIAYLRRNLDRSVGRAWNVVDQTRVAQRYKFDRAGA